MKPKSPPLDIDKEVKELKEILEILDDKPGFWKEISALFPKRIHAVIVE